MQARAMTPARRTALVTAGIVLVAANLRPAITAVGPVVADVQAGLGLSATAAGLLTTLPLVAFAAGSPLAAAVARRAGTVRTLAAALALVCCGILVRSAGGAAAAFAGTAVAGAGIAAGNVLLPGLVKREFPARSGALTSVYLTVLVGFAGLAAAASVPLAETAGLGWRGALAAWALPAALGLGVVAWLARAEGADPAPAATAARPHARFPWRSALAWQVTAFMGLQSLLFFSLIAWLPEILRDRGLAASSAGLLLGVMQIGSLAATIAVPVLAAHRRDQRPLVALSTGICALAFGGLLVAGGALAAVWALLLGVGSGAYLSLALTFFVLRAHDARHTEALSGMAQSAGYAVAATGPTALGALHDATGSWTPPLLAFLAVTLAIGAAGLGAGRPVTVTAEA